MSCLSGDAVVEEMRNQVELYRSKIKKKAEQDCKSLKCDAVNRNLKRSMNRRR